MFSKGRGGFAAPVAVAPKSSCWSVLRIYSLWNVLNIECVCAAADLPLCAGACACHCCLSASPSLPPSLTPSLPRSVSRARALSRALSHSVTLSRALCVSLSLSLSLSLCLSLSLTHTHTHTCRNAYVDTSPEEAQFQDLQEVEEDPRFVTVLPEVRAFLI
jgi:hypothetical protein